LGRPVTFLGQWEKLQIIIVCVRDTNGCPENKHKLPMPFSNDDVKGDLLLMKVDHSENAVPQDFTMKEYEEFKNREPEEWQMKKPGEGEGAEEEGEDDEEEGDEEEEEDEHEEEHDGEDDEDDEEQMGAFVDMMLGKVLEQFEANNGRKASEVEKAALRSTLEAKFGEQVEVDEDEEEDEEGEEGGEEEEGSRGAMLEKIVGAFKEEHGRDPTMEEIKDVLRNIQQEQQEAASEGGPAKKQKVEQ
jgi:hypothetical protein